MKIQNEGCNGSFIDRYWTLVRSGNEDRRGDLRKFSISSVPIRLGLSATAGDRVTEGDPPARKASPIPHGNRRRALGAQWCCRSIRINQRLSSGDRVHWRSGGFLPLTQKPLRQEF